MLKTDIIRCGDGVGTSLPGTLMKLVTRMFRTNDGRIAVTRNADAHDPKGVVGHVVLRDGKWYIEGDDSQASYENENLAAGALVRSLPPD